MMKLPAILVLAAACLVSAFEKPRPMEAGKTVEIERGFLGSKYKQEGHVLNPNSLYDVLGGYPESKEAVSSAKMWMYPGMAFGAVGGFLVGFEAVQPIFGKNLNVPLLLAGVGSAMVGMVLGKVSDNKLARGVEAYNEARGKTGFQLQLQPTGAGLTLSLRF